MARIEECPQGHTLTPFIAMAGTCDGCLRIVYDGEQVHDCRRCNFYLCDDCRPSSRQVGDGGFFGVLKNLFMGHGCGYEASDYLHEFQVQENVPKVSLRHGRGAASQSGRNSGQRSKKRVVPDTLPVKAPELSEVQGQMLGVETEETLKAGATDPSPASSVETCEPPEDALIFGFGDDDTPKSSTSVGATADSASNLDSKDLYLGQDWFANLGAVPWAGAVGAVGVA